MPPRRGDSHNRGRGTHRGGRGSNPNRGNGSAPRSGLPRPQRAPRDVCDYYWANGACNRGYMCTFKHQERDLPHATSPFSTSAVSKEELDFFSPEGLAANTGTIRTSEQDLKPHEVHNHLKLFANSRVGFVGMSASRVEGFGRIFGSVSRANRHWNMDSAQEFLDFVVQTDIDTNNTFYLLGELLRWPSVTFDAGISQTNLSFQRGYVPILQFFSSDLITRSAMHQNVHKLYTLVEGNYASIHRIVMTNMEKLIISRTWRDPNRPGREDTFGGVVLFEVLMAFFSEYFKLFKSAIRNHPELLDLVESIARSFDLWADCVSSSTFRDSICDSQPAAKRLTINKLREDTYRLRSIVRREAGVADEQRRLPGARDAVDEAQVHEAFISRLEQTYMPPGDLHEGGARHDNDFEEIANIRVAPTRQELLCPIPPYLPCFVPDAPHHLLAGSMEKHLDIQFRLLREELISTIRQSVNAVMLDRAVITSRTSSGSQKRNQLTQLENLTNNKGGAYRSSGADSVFFHVYTNAKFAPVKAERRNFTVGLEVDAPPGDARHEDSKKRVEFWERSRRLSNGNLVALMLTSSETQIFLGTVVSFGNDIGQSAKRNQHHIELRISFFDSEVALLALRGEGKSDKSFGCGILLDNSVMYESVHPFLETLKSVEPTSIPFGDVISSEASLAGLSISPPRYASVPGFRFKLNSLLPKTAPPLQLDAQDHASIAHARAELERRSSLDPSQATAMIDALTQQICLIQGPPGTGKSFTGKELLRVLFDNKIKPIVLMAFTNHALDHMLLSVLDANITSKMVRLGSRSSDERIAQFNLTKLEMELGEVSSLDVSRRREYRRMKEIEEEMVELIDSISLPQVHWTEIQSYLDIHFQHAVDAITMPAPWILKLIAESRKDEEQGGLWIEAKKKRGSRNANFSIPKTPFGFWVQGRDIDFLKAKAEDPNSDPRIAFFASLKMSVPLPPNDKRNRQLHVLQNDPSLWSMSKSERRRLVEAWETDIRQLAYDSKLNEFEHLEEEYKSVCRNVANVHDQTRQKILCNTDLIGCTTTGAAKLVSLLTSVAPKVLVVEEAGQVLESHILAALVPSVEHLICIGDPEQLRPTLSNYKLSMDSERGKRLFKFDRSLLERLSSNEWPMSLINVQRRMRPSISQFPRQILYPSLQDNALVHEYPNVQGMRNNVFFLSHTNHENEEKDSVSKYNTFEVSMMVDLVLYLLKQGVYNGTGDIAVLCAYLGQLQKVRAALRNVKLAVAVDERDELALERQGVVAEDTFESVDVAKIVRLGTVDTFQGEEAKIVIISLVRNSGDFSGDASIGFLKSSNRINVALSRAKHGMYIFGNSANLRQNKTWEMVLDLMEEQDLVDSQLAIMCPRHPSEIRWISQPRQITTIAPEGGCLARCEFQLQCGHTCQSVCHPDQDKHGRMKCHEPCQRISCPRKHPCSKECGDMCGPCEFPMYNVRLPCNHIARAIRCSEFDSLEKVKCTQKVTKNLPKCEHTAVIPCHKDPGTFLCRSVCGQKLPCCGRQCAADCHKCQKLNNAPTRTSRTMHEAHKCERLLYCQHQCGVDCSQEHVCNNECKGKCWQFCSHRSCGKPCSEPCPPCMQPCDWRCVHDVCPVPCGSICSRLPCDIPCPHTVGCSHLCPSICGEVCPQWCLTCTPMEKKAAVVDFIMQRTLADLDPTSDNMSERIITLTCGHTFTVETLDGHCNMADFYEVDSLTGGFRGVKAPPINFLNPPGCPTCRGPITARRYGRVTKRAYLDILERNVASSMTKTLAKAEMKLRDASLRMDELKTNARAMKLTTELHHRKGENDKLKSAKPQKQHRCPLSVESLTEHRSLHSDESKQWEKVIKPFLEAYKHVQDTAKTQGPHVGTYDAALSTLYRLELDAIRSDPLRVCDAPEPLAIAEVDNKIGQPPHRADTRYQVEAFFVSIIIRFQICQIAEHRMEGLTSGSSAVAAWREYITFIYESCIQDGVTAVGMATRSFATRQVARGEVLKLKSKFHQFSFSLLCRREDYARAGDINKTEIKAGLVGEIAAAKNEAIAALDECQKQYLRSRPSTTTEERGVERKWFQENCRSVMVKYLQEFDELRKHVLSNEGYQPLSKREKEEIVRAMDFGYRGHFYNCQNGHTFVITECGGATETARCPECQAPIGGNNHTLLGSNTRAMEYEDIARNQGNLDPHWAWGRGA